MIIPSNHESYHNRNICRNNRNMIFFFLTKQFDLNIVPALSALPCYS